MQTEVHGWKVELTSHPRPEVEPDESRRKPEVILTKGKEFVRIRGPKGSDPEILLGRAVVDALRKDVANARDPRSKRDLEKLMRRAALEERLLMMDRLPLPDEIEPETRVG